MPLSSCSFVYLIGRVSPLADIKACSHCCCSWVVVVCVLCMCVCVCFLSFYFDIR